jgi:acyl carrier protein
VLSDTQIQQINAIIVWCLSIEADQLQPKRQLIEELYADSLALLDMVIMLNEEFAIDISGEEIIAIRTVADVYQTVKNNLQSIVQE